MLVWKCSDQFIRYFTKDASHVFVYLLPTFYLLKWLSVISTTLRPLTPILRFTRWLYVQQLSAEWECMRVC